MAVSRDEANLSIAHDMVLAWHHERDDDFDALVNQVLTDFDIRTVLSGLASMNSFLITRLENEGSRSAEEIFLALGRAVSLPRSPGDTG